MNTAYKVMTVFLISILIIGGSGYSWAESWKMSNSSITETTPVVFKSSEEDIPVRVETKVSPWTWAVVTLLVLAGGAVASANISKKEENTSSGTTANTGNSTVHW